MFSFLQNLLLLKHFIFEIRCFGYFFILLAWIMLILSYSKHFIFILIYFELLLLGISLLYISTSYMYNDGIGYLIVLLILIFAAIETAFGLTLLIMFKYNNQYYNIRYQQG